MKITMYIGSDDSRKIDESYLQKVHSILQKYFKGYTLQIGIGVWEGQQEESIEVIVLIQNLIIQELEACIDELKQTLHQDRIIYAIELLPWTEK
ncbi:MAG: hypothetical protein HYT16_01425 [DPANN group archaeon]|nr:hypothetical protein [DPANN group archaeon]